ncbi:hypothetical protein ACFL6C_05630 [Myxococcota bacterium]
MDPVDEVTEGTATRKALEAIGCHTISYEGGGRFVFRFDYGDAFLSDKLEEAGIKYKRLKQLLTGSGHYEILEQTD